MDYSLFCTACSCLQVHSSGAVLKLEEACPWKEHLFELERTLGLSESAKFMLYKEGDSDKWRVQVSQGVL